MIKKALDQILCQKQNYIDLQYFEPQIELKQRDHKQTNIKQILTKFLPIIYEPKPIVSFQEKYVTQSDKQIFGLSLNLQNALNNQSTLASANVKHKMEGLEVSDSSDEYFIATKAHGAPPSLNLNLNMNLNMKPEAPRIQLSLQIEDTHSVMQSSRQISSSRTQQSNNVTGRSLPTTRRLKQQKLDEQQQVMSQITSTMFLSGLEPSRNLQLLQDNKITHVLNLVGDLQPTPVFPQYKYLIFKTKDGSSENIQSILYECFYFIQQAQKTGILIHCQQGVSRSSSIVIAYLMLCNNLSYSQAYAHCRSIRSIVQPNMGFAFQLVEWFRQRHSNIYLQLSCELISQKLFIKNIKAIEEVIELDSAIKDTVNSNIYKCAYSPRKDVDAAIFRLTMYNNDQNLLVLKKEMGKLEYFDPRFIYVVTQLPLATYIFFGEQLGQIQLESSEESPHSELMKPHTKSLCEKPTSRSQSVSASQSEAYDSFKFSLTFSNDTKIQAANSLPPATNIEPTNLIQQLESNENLRAQVQDSTIDELYDPELTDYQIILKQISNVHPELRVALARQIALMCRFEKVNQKIVCFTQEYIQNTLKLNKDNHEYVELVYVLSKIKVVNNIKTNPELESSLEMARIQGKSQFSQTKQLDIIVPEEIKQSISSMNFFKQDPEHDFEFKQLQQSLI
ncbi:Dual_specificity phosphatase [Hexamita inflata]|uniref:Dual specificity phosphatase n=1 Tax=Hexamita inflata TaxID=28002 RepID=A0AA86P7C7_9EUKA|nr:Dual specificity phosphatase [Hexamita inflata]